jgi:3-methyladenine DNA glycosylase AlkD
VTTTRKRVPANPFAAKPTSRKRGGAQVKTRVKKADTAPKRAVRAVANPVVTPTAILGSLLKLGNAGAAEISKRFFHALPGGYGGTDKFLGIAVPQLRALARDFPAAGVEVALPLLKSGWHEARALALILLVRLFERGDEATREKIFSTYMRHLKFINNWDLVDMSAERIVGAWLADKDRSLLTTLAKSKSIWARRIAILATFHYIKKGEYAETLRIAQLLLKDEEDLIQKAVGWMLREVGKRVSREAEEGFLKRHYKQMPRTMLRYAIERFAEPTRKRYLRGEI